MYYIYSREYGYYNFVHHVWQDDIDEDCYTNDRAFASGICDTYSDAVIHVSISASY